MTEDMIYVETNLSGVLVFGDKKFQNMYRVSTGTEPLIISEILTKT